MASFWQTLPRPFFAMAPMADVTDSAWRALVAACGKPDVLFTEFVSADGLYHTHAATLREGEHPLLRDLHFSEAERPVVAQIFSGDPAMIAHAAQLVAKLRFDGVDLNMGCPDAAIERQGSGAALIKDPKRAALLIRAAKEVSELPVSVKTRVGYGNESLEEWLSALLAEKPAAITLHLRTRRERSLTCADWLLMRKAVAIRDRVAKNVLLIGNGDVEDLEDARAKAAASGADGVMIGRGVFGNPWLFAGRKRSDVSLAEKLAALTELARRFEELRPPKHFAIFKKHVKAFVAGFDGAAQLRAALMRAESAADLERALAENPV